MHDLLYTLRKLFSPHMHKPRHLNKGKQKLLWLFDMFLNIYVIKQSNYIGVCSSVIKFHAC